MFNQEQLIEWFTDLKSYERLEFFCTMLHICHPLELRFLGSCVENLGKKDYLYLREYEIRANDATQVAEFELLSSYGGNCKLNAYLSLLRSTNTVCAKLLFEKLVQWNNHLSLEKLRRNEDDYNIDSILLMYTMAVNHPAFTFAQQRTLIQMHQKFKHIIDKTPQALENGAPPLPPIATFEELQLNGQTKFESCNINGHMSNNANVLSANIESASSGGSSTLSSPGLANDVKSPRRRDVTKSDSSHQEASVQIVPENFTIKTRDVAGQTMASDWKSQASEVSRGDAPVERRNGVLSNGQSNGVGVTAVPGTAFGAMPGLHGVVMGPYMSTGAIHSAHAPEHYNGACNQCAAPKHVHHHQTALHTGTEADECRTWTNARPIGFSKDNAVYHHNAMNRAAIYGPPLPPPHLPLTHLRPPPAALGAPPPLAPPLPPLPHDARKLHSQCYNCGGQHRASDCVLPSMEILTQGTYHMQYIPRMENG